MTEIGLIEIGQSLEGFEVIYPKENPWGLTAKLLKSLWDMVIDKGWSSGSQSLIYKADNFSVEISFNLVRESVVMKVFKPGAFPQYQSHKLKNNVALFWNESLSPEEAEEEINLISGVNQPSSQPFSQIKIGINEFFQPRDKFLIIAPETDTQKVLSEFDQPQLLELFRIRKKGSNQIIKIICLKCQKEKVKRILRYKFRYLKNNGSIPEDTAELSDEEFFNLLTKEI